MTDLNKKELSRGDAEVAEKVTACGSCQRDHHTLLPSTATPSKHHPGVRRCPGTGTQTPRTPRLRVPNPCFLAVIRGNSQKVVTQRRRAAEKNDNATGTGGWDRPNLEWKVAKRSNQTSNASGSAVQSPSISRRLCVSACQLFSLFPARLTNITSDAMVRAFKLELNPHGH